MFVPNVRFVPWLVALAAILAAYSLRQQTYDQSELAVADATRLPSAGESSNEPTSERPASGSDDSAGTSVALRRELDNFRKELAHVQQNVSGQTKNDSISVETSVTDIASHFGDAQAEGAREAERITALLDGYVAEAVPHGGWSAAASAEVMRAIEQLPTSATQLQDARCASALCRIHSIHVDTNAELMFLRALAESEFFSNAEALMTRKQNDDGSLMTTTYISRAGTSLPR